MNGQNSQRGMGNNGTMFNRGNMIMQPQVSMPQNIGGYYGFGQTNNVDPNQNMIIQPGFPGKFVSSEEDIRPNEVPMDGSVGVFFANDYSKIYAKQWNAKGTIDTVVYIPEVIDAEVKDISDANGPLNQILERLDAIEEMLAGTKSEKVEMEPVESEEVKSTKVTPKKKG